jgi:hypothetical protein
MARTCRHVASHPQDGREIGRLLRAGPRSTVRLRLPWLPFRLIDELDDRLQPGMRVFEYGGGGSTLWFLDHGLKVVTIEHDATWARILESNVASPLWTLRVLPLGHEGAEYIRAIEDYPDGEFDLVVVDGRYRSRCTEAAIPKVRHGGMLIVDDVDRPRYATALEAVPWPRRDIIGFAPAKPSLSYTGLFVRPDE